MSNRRWVRLSIPMFIVLACLYASRCSPPEATVAPATPEATIASPLPATSPVPSPPTSAAMRTPTEVAEGIRITIVYDNNAFDPRLRTAWGFACLIEFGDLTLLFDTGGDAATLLSNMDVLGLDPRAIDIVVLSHIHGDHVGGLGGILAVNKKTTVYVPRSFPAGLKKQIGASAHVVEVHETLEIAEGIYTTGEMGSGIIEQSLVLVTRRGLVVITGCAHPGIVNIVARAEELTGGEVYLVMGGFHLSGESEGKIEGIIADFRRLGVQKVAPCHCTGSRAMEIFAAEYGEDFIKAGVGRVLEIGQ